MKLHEHLSRIISVLLILVVTNACTSTPTEELSISLSSPASQLDSGVHHYNNNNYSRAIPHFEKALSQYRSIDNQTGIASSCLNLAKTHMAINNNNIAGNYLTKASIVIKQAGLAELDAHLHLLKSSLAINSASYNEALLELESVLNSKSATIQLAALKNRTRIAFTINANDKLAWLKKYKILQQNNPENTASHLARILRYEASLNENDNAKTKLLKESLIISREIPNRTAIAATLSQWATLDTLNNRYSEAEDKYLRALFIRHQLGDIKNSKFLLQELKSVYSLTHSPKKSIVERWLKEFSNQDFSNWEQLLIELDSYPKAP